MAADANGNDVSKVFVPVTGNLGVAPAGTDIPGSAEGGAVGYILPVEFKRPGLITEDGGFEWTLEADGDPIKFYQQGFSIPSGLANATLVVKLAQTDNIVRSIIHGQTPDVNGYLEIDAGGTDVRYVIFTEEIAKNGDIRRRIAADAGISSLKEDKSENGTLVGYEVTFSVERSSKLNNKHLGEWIISPSTIAIPVLTALDNATAAGGTTVKITGTGFGGATGVKFGAANATLYVIDSATQIRAVVPGTGAATANVTVINSAGTSNALPFSRTA